MKAKHDGWIKSRNGHWLHTSKTESCTDLNYLSHDLQAWRPLPHHRYYKCTTCTSYHKNMHLRAVNLIWVKTTMWNPITLHNSKRQTRKKTGLIANIYRSPCGGKYKECKETSWKTTRWIEIAFDIADKFPQGVDVWIGRKQSMVRQLQNRIRVLQQLRHCTLALYRKDSKSFQNHWWKQYLNNIMSGWLKVIKLLK